MTLNGGLHHVLKTLFQASFILSLVFLSEGQTVVRKQTGLRQRKGQSISHIYLFITSECSQLEKNTQTNIVAGCSRTCMPSSSPNIHLEMKYWMGISRASLGSGTKGFFPFFSFSGEILISSGLPTPDSAVLGALLMPLQDFW